MNYIHERRIIKMIAEDGFTPPSFGDRHAVANRKIADYITILRSDRDKYLRLLSGVDDPATEPSEGSGRS